MLFRSLTGFARTGVVLAVAVATVATGAATASAATDTTPPTLNSPV